MSGERAVPWNAAWTGEDRFELRPCRYAQNRMALWQPFAPGKGKPIFAKPHMVRQRRSVAKFICTVCGEHAPPQDRWWFRLGNFGDGRFRTTESPVHRNCAEIAQKVCPHLRSLGIDPSPFPMMNCQIEASLIYGDAAERDFGLRLPNPVVGALKFSWPEGLFVTIMKAQRHD